MLRQITAGARAKGLFAALFVFGVTFLAPASDALAACRGAWAEGVQYAAGDTVTFNGTVYTARVAHGCNGCGWNPVAAPSLWEQGGTCAGGGNPTPNPTATPRPGPTPTPRPGATPTPNPGNGGTCAAAWSATTIYTGGQQVSRNGQNYQAAFWTQNNDPATMSGPAGSGAPWTQLGSCTGGGNPGPTPTPRPGSTPTPTPGPTTLPNPNPGPRVFAPYIDMSLGASGATVQNLPGSLRAVTLSFLVAAGGNCSTGWGGLGGILPQDNLPNGTSMLTIVNNLKASGKAVIISFGGAAGQEPAAACTSAASLQALYQSVINRYRPIGLDFDIEGGSVGNMEFNTRRAQALRGLKAANSGVTLSYTLPVLPSGLVATGIALLNHTRAAGYNPDVINVMAMDYGSAVDNGGQMGLNAELAGQATRNQVAAAGLSSRIGITPMIGVNDVATEVFTLADANRVVNFARNNSFVTRLAFWSLSRDNGGCAGAGFASPTCSGISQGNFAFSNAFSGF